MDHEEEELEEVSAYVLNAFDCPVCGEQNLTDADLGAVEACMCGEKVKIL